MKKIYNRVKAFFNTIRGKIAFYPTLLGILGFGITFIMSALEYSDASSYLKKTIPQIIVKNPTTARTILSVSIGSIISIMVFSFSTVMLLLSQASSNFSPRLLPGLISDRKNQIILGVYLASIIYLIFTLFSIEDTSNASYGLSVFVGVLATVCCLGLFIFFIHNMSQSIQINNILDAIYSKAKKRLNLLIDEESNNIPPESFEDTSEWYPYYSKTSGYFQNISLTNTLQFCETNDTKLSIIVPKGFYVLQNSPFFLSKTELSEEQVEEMLSNINFSRGELIDDNYILAFKQIVEIAVKAMSPGVNDPGTAINAIDYLTELLALRMQKKDSTILSRDETTLLKIESVAFKDLLYYILVALRTYSVHDPIITRKILVMLRYLKNCEAPSGKDYKSNIEKEIKRVVKDAKINFNAQEDWELLNKKADSILNA